ncbi:ankyrin repeat, SAM and basic leucine zipper domain-containing protein 1 isoform X3 [Cynoglossus semilaevis]|uniref:ankyrin repeat, SAM and basic leucine zipper domain-containing protein 1 isoform X3 n=1 Tax=Cynoglossus semilaevis TaxID=244447 RepID=UPI0007DC8F3B|nr:ankyrin repeat, SAM and basic leucine zipper domain-containing protein 1 isoform X3 [Cynoglossus semilaevis]
MLTVKCCLKRECNNFALCFISGIDRNYYVTNNLISHVEDNVFMLKKAISKGDIKTVEKLLDNGMDVETRLGFGWSLLMCAVNMANYDLAKLLLERGASANFSKDNWTALMASCTASASEDKISHCMELLLSRNADPNVANRTQMTCLMLAAREGYSKIINLLLSHGADVDLQEENGHTALSIAVRYGKENAVLKLLQLGANTSIKNNAGKTPADLAVTFKHAQIAKILDSSSNISLMQSSSTMEENLSEFLQTNSGSPSSKESVTRLDGIDVFLHGLDLGFLSDILKENDITWADLLTMEKEDLEKIGITVPEHQHKLMNAVQQMQLNKIDMGTIILQARTVENTELLDFLISIHQQTCILTQAIHDLTKRFPKRASQLVFSLDPDQEAQALCNKLEVQAKDLQKEVANLRCLLYQMEKAEGCCNVPKIHIKKKQQWSLSRVALSVAGATSLVFLYKAFSARASVFM